MTYYTGGLQKAMFVWSMNHRRTDLKPGTLDRLWMAVVDECAKIVRDNPDAN